jgi:hypothetical protein
MAQTPIRDYWRGKNGGLPRRDQSHLLYWAGVADRKKAKDAKEKEAKEEKARRLVPPPSIPGPVYGSMPAEPLQYISAEPPSRAGVSVPPTDERLWATGPRRRSRPLIGGISTWVIQHVWPFTALWNLSEQMRELNRKTRAVVAIIAGFALIAVLTVHHTHREFAQNAVAFIFAAAAGWILPTVAGFILVWVVALCGIAVELCAYAAVVWGVVEVIKLLH